MAYEKQNFENGQVLKAEHLNHIEDGIVNQSYNDLKDKPFGEFYGDTLTWEIDFGNLSEDDFIAKISDAIVTMGDLSNGCTLDSLGETYDLSSDMFEELSNGVVWCPDFFLLFVDENGAGFDFEGVVFPTAGVYIVIEFLSGSLTIPNYEGFSKTVKIDSKYVPDEGTTVLYRVGNSLFKDYAGTEALTRQELVDLAMECKRVVIRDSEGCYEAVAIKHSTDTVYHYGGFEILESHPAENAG